MSTDSAAEKFSPPHQPPPIAKVSIEVEGTTIDIEPMRTIGGGFKVASRCRSGTFVWSKSHMELESENARLRERVEHLESLLKDASS